MESEETGNQFDIIVVGAGAAGMAAALSASETARNLNLNNFHIAVREDRTNLTGAETLGGLLLTLEWSTRSIFIPLLRRISSKIPRAEQTETMSTA